MHYARPADLRIRRQDPLLPIMLLVYLVLQALTRTRRGRFFT